LKIETKLNDSNDEMLCRDGGRTVRAQTVALIANQAFSLTNFRGPLIRDMVARGHHVVALAPDFDAHSRAALRALGAEPVDYPLARTGMNPFQDMKALIALRRALKRIRPDVSLAYFTKPVIYGTLAAAWAGVPRRMALIAGLGFAFTDDGQPLNVKRRFLRSAVSALYRLALNRAHRVLLQNPDDIREFTRRGLVALDKAMCIGGTGVDLTEWPVAPLLRLPEFPITFALTARLLREKGVLEYVAAARIIKARHPNTRFLLLGGLDENPGALSGAEVQAWVAEGIVEWPGHVPVRDWLAQAHVYVLPSFYREGVPRSTQEAMAMGRPVITTDAPGCRETVVDGVNGFLVPPRDVEALVGAMQRFIREPGLIARMGAESHRLAEDWFDVRRINAAMMREMGL
jgi:glycosyltransferase involved in cell wall biosynthesis